MPPRPAHAAGQHVDDGEALQAKAMASAAAKDRAEQPEKRRRSDSRGGQRRRSAHSARRGSSTAGDVRPRPRQAAGDEHDCAPARGRASRTAKPTPTAALSGGATMATSCGAISRRLGFASGDTPCEGIRVDRSTMQTRALEACATNAS